MQKMIRISVFLIIAMSFLSCRLALAQSGSSDEELAIASSASPYVYYAPKDVGERNKAILDKNVSVEFLNTPREMILQKITEDTDLRLIYSKYVIPEMLDDTIDLHLEEATVLGALYAALGNTGLGLKITNRGLLIVHDDVSVENAESVGSEGLTEQAERPGNISGRITDATTGGVLPGANVIIEELKIGAATDQQGRFRIRSVPPGDYTLRVSYLGYHQHEVEITIEPGDELTQNFALQDDFIEGQDILVVAELRGQARAYSQQRIAPNIKDVVSAEQLERFADQNIAASLLRIPGMGGRLSRGEPSGRFIMRGLSFNNTNVLVDGQRQGSTTTAERGTDIEGVPVDMISSLEVTKAITPDMDADAVGGTVNMVTRRQVGDEPNLNVLVGGGFNNNARKPNARTSVTYGQEVIENLRLSVSANYNRDRRQSERIGTRWDIIDFGDGPETVLERFTPEVFRTDRERIGFSTHLDYDFSPTSRFYFRGTYNDYTEIERRSRWRMDMGGGTFLSAEEATDVRAERTEGRTVTEMGIYNLSVGGENQFSSLRMDYNLNYSHTRKDDPTDISFDFRQDGLNVYDLDAMDVTFPDITPGAGFEDMGAYQLRRVNDRGNEDSKDVQYAFSLNFELPYEIGSHEGSIQWGGKFASMFNDKNVQNHRYLFDELFPLDDVREGFSILGDRYHIDPIIDWEKSVDFFNENKDLFEFDEDRARDQLIWEYGTDENITAGYLMNTLEINNLLILAGARLEHTAGTYRSFSQDRDYDEDGQLVSGELEPVESKHSYLNAFPSLHLRYGLWEMTDIRFALTHGITRPNFYQVNPLERIRHDREEIRRGNPELRPAYTRNWDLSIEHYFKSVGNLSAGVFYKDIEDYEERITVQIDDGGPFDGWDYEYPINAASMKVWGAEFSWNQRLDFLPGVLSGFGLYATYTYTDSEGKILEPEEKEIYVRRQPPHIVNLALSYQRGGFSGQLSMNYVDAMVGRFDNRTIGDTLYDRMDEPGWNASFTANQRILPNLRVYVEAQNLANQIEGRYWGESLRDKRFPDRRLTVSWTGFIGLRYTI